MHLHALHADAQGPPPLGMCTPISQMPAWDQTRSFQDVFLGLPVGYHLGTGPPGAIYLGFSNYRARLHSALTMEEVLVKHPKLRLYLMHAGYPLLDDMLAMLYSHPQLYVDVGVIV